MNIDRLMKRYTSSAVVWAGLLCSLPSTASEHTVLVDFTEQGTFQAESFQQGPLTITGSDQLNFLQLNGLGIVGQIDHAIDPGEFVVFSFSSPVNFVKLINGSIGNPSGIKFNTANIEAFGIGGISLGTLSGVEPSPSIVVSGLFGDALITSFSVMATEDIYRFSALEYALASAVPEPDSGWMMMGGLCLLLYSIRLARRA
ncbi:hypothetical protein NMQ14_18650 [Methyloversatilis sp. XJ19-13]|uniref:hypothetical protein n=1 Tax=Methyloversatilis sp. XJ19-13 TaxID=2963430 RepID=UPI00211C27BF|nr:hypothetical protein [Methyloversatilis sp. XJ19-13]MCQ9376270.1 hypothetical protein [Methyloversatilis sp. XJ19-13]